MVKPKTVMKRPKPQYATDIADAMPYPGEWYQPDDRVYLKHEADEYFEYLENKIKEKEMIISLQD